NFAMNHHWDSSSNTLSAGSKSIDCTTSKNYLGFIGSSNSNEAPDLGSVNSNLFDWIQASSLYTYSTL
ncbi:MAG: hypothetical protein ACRECH_13350, partial [Nitrososphaerales archaeon]